ncbi:hypothetical protein M407DRAFT_229759 [Tulasnella calospora MUT 4182]|uniref:Uncharacterized protein n=1 Tax=Tulasnella calospora MUT 4182 TaxID=1051891 RepID=A0A0C3QXP9_9AGAM|nr:hypothetical protein M407DRAFT_229759 [Tulasnella calospora MUT 4182]
MDVPESEATSVSGVMPHEMASSRAGAAGSEDADAQCAVLARKKKKATMNETRCNSQGDSPKVGESRDTITYVHGTDGDDGRSASGGLGTSVDSVVSSNDDDEHAAVDGRGGGAVQNTGNSSTDGYVDDGGRAGLKVEPEPSASMTSMPKTENSSGEYGRGPMVRHEVGELFDAGGRTSPNPPNTKAADALGAIFQADSSPILRKYLDDPERAVRETCEVAIAKIEWNTTPEGQAERVRREVEKAEAEANGTIRSTPVADLRSQLLDTSIPLFQRYRAMSALGNIGTHEAIDALADGFSDDSALFK